MKREDAIKKVFGYGGNGHVAMPEQIRKEFSPWEKSVAEMPSGRFSPCRLPRGGTLPSLERMIWPLTKW